MKVKIKLKEGVEVPKYATKGSAAFDIAALGMYMLNPGETTLIDTGIFLEIPEGYELQIIPRSGLSYKTGFRIANTPGCVDSDFRGEIKIIGQNTGKDVFMIGHGDRIAQGKLVEIEQAEFEVVTELSQTERGEGGFGSTGV